jgi:hypothetical protein
MHIYRLLLGLTIYISLLLLISCQKEWVFTTSPTDKVTFSSDTLRFDTVFTQIGSSTRILKIYNPSKDAINISSLYLAAGANSKFKINVDGFPGAKALKDIPIYPKDSIYLFATVTINPNSPLSVSPFIFNEDLILEVNGNKQVVTLEAWGQNANYFPSRFNKGVPVVLSCKNGEINWNDPKPYVLYGEIFIDSCTLNIPPGTRIYVHGGVVKNKTFGVFNDGILYTLPFGKLLMNGTFENPIVIQGDRLEPEYQDVAGQWYGIILGRGSKGNKIQYTTIKNSIVGLYVDSTAECTLKNARIFNTASNGLVGVRATIQADNCLIYNNGGSAVQCINGGDYQFNYCTIASYGSNSSALGMTNYICYDDPVTCQRRSQYRLNATFRNSIFYGSDQDEINLSDISSGQNKALFNILFENCVVRVKDLLTGQNKQFSNFLTDQCKNCINGSIQSKVFKNPSEDDYTLDSLSVAANKGLPLLKPYPILIDLINKNRDSANPDIGCFEQIK